MPRRRSAGTPTTTARSPAARAASAISRSSEGIDEYPAAEGSTRVASTAAM